MSLKNSSQKSLPKKTEFNNKSIKSDFKILIILLLLAAGCIAFMQIYFKGPIEIDRKLIEPQIEYSAQQLGEKALSHNDLNALINSFKNAEIELPAQGIIPEFTPEQSRPSRHLIKQESKKAEKLLFSDKITREDLFNSFTTFDLAYSHTKSPQYVNFVLGLVNQYDSLEIDELLLVMNLIKNQKKTIALTSSKAYIDFYASALAKLKSIAAINRDPLIAIKVFYAMILLPKGLNTEELLSAIKPILKDAFNHKNATRTDGLFLTSEQSTAFSLQLINVVWQYHLDKKEMPDWLYELAEKESCRLAYRLEPDGCLPDWSGENKRFSLTQDIYKAALVFDRDDLRFVAYGGRRMENAYPPLQRNFVFLEIGETIIRNNWNIYHLSNLIQNNFLGNYNDCFQLSIRLRKREMAVYGATADVGVFKITTDLNLEKSTLSADGLFIVDDGFIGFNVISKLKVEIELKKMNLEETRVGLLYKKKGDLFDVFDRSQYIDNWTRYKPVWEFSINNVEQGSMLIFSCKRKYKFFNR